MDSTAFASPYPQTPTPGGSANPNQLNRPPLTSLKPFGYSGTPKALIRKPNTPHPLAQNNITLNQTRIEPDQSLEEDLRAFEQEQRNRQRGPIIARSSRVSDDLTEDEEYDDENSHSAQTTTIDDQEELQDSDFDQDSDSLGIGLSSLSPPGIGRASHHPGQLSTVTLDPEEDFTYQGGQDFSRDLSALSLSPIRRPSAPTPQRASIPPNDQDLTMDDERSEISQTPVSGFQGMARQLRRDFEQITGVPSSGRPKTTKGNGMGKESARGGTLKGGLPANDGIRAKRVFGAELDQGLKPPRLNQLHSVGLTSTPPAKFHSSKLPQQDHNQQKSRNVLADLKNQIPSRATSHQIHKPLIRIVDATTDSSHPTGHDSSLPPAIRKIVGNSVRVPDVTGLTDALCSPEKADFPLGSKPSGARTSSESAPRPDPTLSEALTLLRRRLGSLETENEACQNLIRDLQSQLNHANQVIALGAGQAAHQPDRNQAAGKAEMERILQKIKTHTRRLTDSIQAHAIAIDELNAFKTRNKNVRHELRGVKSEVRQWSDEVEDMKSSLEGLTSEVREMRSMVERLVKTASQPASATNTQAPGPSQPGMSRRGTATTKAGDSKAPFQRSQPAVKRHLPPVSAPKQPTQSQETRNDIEDWRSQTSTTVHVSGQSFIGPDEIQNLKRDVEQEQRLKLAAQGPPKARPHATNANPSASSSRPPPPVNKYPAIGTSRAPPTRTSSAPVMKLGGNAEPVRATDDVSRGEAILNSLPKGRHDDMSCSQCRLRRQKGGASNTLSSRNSSAPMHPAPSKKKEERDEPDDDDDEDASLPPQAVLVGILKDLEQDFEVHRKIFVELSDTYRKMNPAAIQVSKRKALAQHLHESVDTLEKKAGHIKHLYDLLHVKDLPHKSGSSKKI
ncbi:hypothetical protein PCANC_27004 [Puccinia coronata f. sp. avenae]|uniref:Cep57 centrosome microtubule-binding domain-containing protein n=1 Tax=Puccinia coronata f. sp. avenae TaxID=200324 RepID=A0A2N5TFM2_9BASI|nr:hypothetical protein PCASD_18710 [Puccinia coronata f. sp. avenae]PLW24306.1 hypothetical protein PCANC_27004 [Puccinia coronata f. sp. avenae]PLW28940.1 hypothetical protein PCASD_17628 [Puccinia coronata f. sp. avenae]